MTQPPTGAQPARVAVMLESDGPGGAETVVFDLASELRQRGHRVYPVGPARGVGWLGEKFRASGFETQTFTLRRALDPRCLLDLARTLRRLRIDLVHSHEFSMAVYGTAAARMIRRPHVITLHGNQKMTLAWRRRAALRWAFRNSAAVVAVSEATKRQLDADLGLDPAAVSVVHNGIPIRRGDPARVRRELGAHNGEVLIVAVGNLIPRKGHIFLLESLQHLSERGLAVPWRVAIAGGRGGEERERLVSFAAEHGCADRVHILSHRDDIPDLLAAADIFAMPSLWEGLPLAVLEAMLAGTAIVASQASGIPEAITSGEHGVLVPPGDSLALASALEPLLSDPAERQRLAAAARARGLAEFTLAAMADSYQRIYRAACGIPDSSEAVESERAAI